MYVTSNILLRYFPCIYIITYLRMRKLNVIVCFIFITLRDKRIRPNVKETKRDTLKLYIVKCKKKT